MLVWQHIPYLAPVSHAYGINEINYVLYILLAYICLTSCAQNTIKFASNFSVAYVVGRALHRSRKDEGLATIVARFVSQCYRLRLTVVYASLSTITYEFILLNKLYIADMSLCIVVNSVLYAGNANDHKSDERPQYRCS